MFAKVISFFHSAKIILLTVLIEKIYGKNAALSSFLKHKKDSIIAFERNKKLTMERKRMLSRLIASALLFLPLSNVLAQHATKIKILDATVKDAVVRGAQVYVQKNGEQSIIGTTDANGEIITSSNFQDNAQTLLIIKKEGYSTLVVKCPCQGYTYALSPTLENDNSIRVVLSWGAQPLDLDVHAIYGRDHVYYYNKLGRGANLDVDDRDSYGPETITINDRRAEQYTFYVHDYTNKDVVDNRALAHSNAKVFLYKGDSLLRTYYVPTEQKGNVWEVFSITEDNRISDYNKINYRYYFDAWQAELYDRVPGYESTDAPAPVYGSGSASSSEVEALIASGETAYRNKQYRQSIDYYQKALEVGRGSAPIVKIINNMALAHYRLGNYGKTMEMSNAVVQSEEATEQEKANAYFNMGLVYEKQKRYRDAAQQYQSAANKVEDNAVYLQNLKRVRKLIK